MAKIRIASPNRVMTVVAASRIRLEAAGRTSGVPAAVGSVVDFGSGTSSGAVIPSRMIVDSSGSTNAVSNQWAVRPSPSRMETAAR